MNIPPLLALPAVLGKRTAASPDEVDFSSQELVEEAIRSAYPPLVSANDDILKWQAGITGVKNEDQALVAGELIERGLIKAPGDLERYAYLWETGFDFSRAVLAEEPALNAEELAFYEELKEEFSHFPPSGETLVPHLQVCYSPSISFGKVLHFLNIDFPGLEDSAVKYLEGEIKSSQEAGIVLASIPSRSILKKLLAGSYSWKLKKMISENWQVLGVSLAQIIYGEDRKLYQNLLDRSLEREELTNSSSASFYAPIMSIDLNDLERKVYPAAVRIIDEDRVLYVVNIDGASYAGAVNPKDTSTIKFFFRRLFPQEEQYFLYYFPKITFAQDGWKASASYEKRDRFMENVIGKDDYQNNLPQAVDNFLRAFAREDQFRAESFSAFKRLISPELLAKIQAEPALELEGIFKLMVIMADSTCRDEAPAIFNITPEKYRYYESRIFELLEKGAGFSQEEFLVEAIKICNGRAALAAVIAFNALLPLGEIGYNSLFVRYPKTFKMLDDIQDQAGSIYHYFGCFFAAYALQRWLVDRYHRNEAFSGEVKEWKSRIEKELKAFDLQKATLDDFFNFLLLVQFQYLGWGDDGTKEIMSLAGIFFEEVIEDRELSRETHQDLRGMSAGHALYELISGRKLDSGETLRKLFVDTVKDFVSSNLSWWQKMLLYFSLF